MFDAGFKNKLVNFSKDEQGAFAIMFGVCATAIMLSAGIALDYTRISHAKSVMDNAVDAAVLSVGHEMAVGRKSKAALKDSFDSFLTANLKTRNSKPDNIVVNSFFADAETGQVVADVSGDVKMSLMQIAGYDKVSVGSHSEAKFSSNNIEISMILDVTGSMAANDKIGSLKLAARDAVNILLPKDSKSDRVRIGLVPYASSINAGKYAKTVKGERRSTSTGPCVTGRSNDTYSDASYEDSSLQGHPRAVNGDQCPKSKIVPLTTKRSKLLREINAMRASGYTAGHLGIAWSYYMLSEKWQPLWGDASDPADYGANVKKVAILMTDGSFNTYFEGTSDTANFGGQGNDSDYAARQICKDMKKPKVGGDGITIYSIAFDAPRDAQKTLRNCATANNENGTYYYSASDENELRAAFAEIAKSIQSLKLSR